MSCLVHRFASSSGVTFHMALSSLQPRESCHLRVLMAAAYGLAPSGARQPTAAGSVPSHLTTPLALTEDQVVSVAPVVAPSSPCLSLSLSRGEYDDLILSWLGVFSLQLDKSIHDYIFTLTAGQASVYSGGRPTFQCLL